MQQNDVSQITSKALEFSKVYDAADGLTAESYLQMPKADPEHYSPSEVRQHVRAGVDLHLHRLTRLAFNGVVRGTRV